MDELINDLAAVVGKHASTLTADEWTEACRRVAQAYFSAEEYPQLDDMSRGMTERVIASMREAPRS